MRALRFITLPLATLGVAASSACAAGPYVSEDGHRYQLVCNDDGVVLTSDQPVSRFVGQGAGTRVVTGIEKLYLGRSCDAWHELFGTGRWGWANYGFWAEFEARRFEFPRQEIICPAPRPYPGPCER
ncbi:MAG: hypothetical protein ACE5FS_03840 [Paracoccaceae bacterium]